MHFDAEFFVAVGFVLFVLLLGYLGVHRTILSALDGRSKMIADELDQARRLREEAEAVLASFKKKAIEAEAEPQAMVAQAKTEADATAKEPAGGMRDFVARRTKQAEAKIAMAEAQAANDVRAIVADVAAKAAETVLKAETKGQAAADLIAKGIGELKSRLVH